MTTATDEIARRERFEFGANWYRFLEGLDDEQVEDATRFLQDMLRADTLAGKRVLDIGSGSGLWSLVAHRLGADVHSFDFDPQSVKCTRELRRRYASGSTNWAVEEGSVLDADYLAQLGKFDVVLCWGVLHHTGAMWRGLGYLPSLVALGGQLFVAIYNDQGWISRYWRFVKRASIHNRALFFAFVIVHMVYPFLPSLFYRTITGRLRDRRGMSFWYDVRDWIGGYPFEVATANEIERFFENAGFRLQASLLTRRYGCNQFVFVRDR